MHDISAIRVPSRARGLSVFKCDSTGATDRRTMGPADRVQDYPVQMAGHWPSQMVYRRCRVSALGTGDLRRTWLTLHPGGSMGSTDGLCVLPACSWCTLRSLVVGAGTVVMVTRERRGGSRYAVKLQARGDGRGGSVVSNSFPTNNGHDTFGAMTHGREANFNLCAGHVLVCCFGGVVVDARLVVDARQVSIFSVMPRIRFEKDYRGPP